MSIITILLTIVLPLILQILQWLLGNLSHALTGQESLMLGQFWSLADQLNQESARRGVKKANYP